MSNVEAFRKLLTDRLARYEWKLANGFSVPSGDDYHNTKRAAEDVRKLLEAFDRYFPE